MLIFKNLTFSYANHTVFSGLNFHINDGEKLAVTGASGSGKSTLLNLLPGFLPGFKGEIIVDDLILNPKHITAIRRKFAYVPQDLHFTVFPTVKELFRAPFTFAANRSKQPTKEKTDAVFDVFELDKQLLNRDIREISGGQKQRIILAIAILLDKPYLLLDEPTSALNKSIKNKITDYIFGLEGKTVLAATHDEYWMEKSGKILNIDTV